jgi:hypothetical protein
VRGLPFSGSRLDLGLRMVWQPPHDASPDGAEPSASCAGQASDGRAGGDCFAGWRRDSGPRGPASIAESCHHAARVWSALDHTSGTNDLDQERGGGATN